MSMMLSIPSSTGRGGGEIVAQGIGIRLKISGSQLESRFDYYPFFILVEVKLLVPIELHSP